MHKPGESGNIVLGILVLLLMIAAVVAIVWFVQEVLPYLLGAAALYGAGIALWNYGQAFAGNVKPGRLTP